jgi:hypothetical protein
MMLGHWIRCMLAENSLLGAGYKFAQLTSRNK